MPRLPALSERSVTSLADTPEYKPVSHELVLRLASPDGTLVRLVYANGHYEDFQLEPKAPLLERP